MPPSTQCRLCEESESFDRPLFKCIACNTYFHSACHRQEPVKSGNCQSCLTLVKDQTQKRYDDSVSVSSTASSHSSQSILSSRSGSSTMSTISHSASSVTTEGSDSDAPTTISCLAPGCSAKVLAKQMFCQAHQQFVTAVPKLHSAPASTSAPQEPCAPPAKVNASAHHDRPQRPGPPKSNKLLPENDKDRPILRRKTAYNPFIQPAPKQSTPAISASSLTQPSSPKLTLARPPAHSPSGSLNKSRDDEPIKKRQKLSHPVNGSSEYRPNGTQASSTDKGASEELNHKAPKDQALQAHCLGSKSPSQKRHGRESEKAGFRLSSHTRPSPVRKMAPPSLRPIDGLGTASQRMERQQFTNGIAQAPARVNGARPSTSHQDNQTQAFDGGYTSQDLSKRAIQRPASSHHIRQAPATNGPIEQGPGTKRTGEASMAEPHFQSSGGDQLYPDIRERPVMRIPDAQMNGRPIYQNQQPLLRGALSSDGYMPPIIHKPNPVQRPSLQPAKVVDEALFDRMIYQQEAAAEPPQGVVIPEPATPTSDPDFPDEPLYADIDPRVHWMQPHSELWLAKKQEEIRARGGRKANFGKAALSLKRQRRKEGPVAVEETLSGKILDNPAWMRALKGLEDNAKELAAPPPPPQGNSVAPTRKKPGPKPGSKRQPPKESLCGPARG